MLTSFFKEVDSDPQLAFAHSLVARERKQTERFTLAPVSMSPQTAKHAANTSNASPKKHDRRKSSSGDNWQPHDPRRVSFFENFLETPPK